MNQDPTVALVLSPRDWATRLHRHAADHGGVRVKARVLQPEEATAGGFEVLVIDDTTSFLNRRLIDELHRQGCKALGVYDGGEFPEGRERLIELGIDAVIDAASSADEFVHKIAGMRPTIPSSPPERAAERLDRGSLVVVGGPFGGTGSTEVAIGIADALSSIGERTVLVDGDDVAPSVAQRLNLALTPNLRTIVDQSRRSDGIGVDDSLGFGVICGIPNSRDWQELRLNDVTGAVTDVCKTADWVVFDVSSGVERLPGEGRFRLARHLIARADVVIGVGLPTPVGVSRLLDWIAEAKALNQSARLLVILNKAPGGSFVRSEVAREIIRVFEPSSLQFLPSDRRVQRASWSGRVVPGGAFRRGVEQLAGGLVSAGASR